MDAFEHIYNQLTHVQTARGRVRVCGVSGGPGRLKVRSFFEPLSITQRMHAAVVESAAAAAHTSRFDCSEVLKLYNWLYTCDDIQ